VAPKRGDAVAPPAADQEYEIRFGTSEAAAQWPELCKRFTGNCREAWDSLRTSPLTRSPKQKPLQGRLATRPIGGMDLPQWQFDISSGARLIYCVDDQKRTVWLVDASAAHPGATVAKGKRSSTNR
jgi:mRNA-degrading endonuclease RelE of RelBE toxin-antitoxin system